MTYKLAINGCGRIGRCILRCIASLSDASVEVIAVNDLMAIEQLAYLLRRDSTHGSFPVSVGHDEAGLLIGGKRVLVLQEKDPTKLPWASLGVDLVIEATGRFCSADSAKVHIDAGGRFVIVSAPAKSVPSVVFGVNHVQVKQKDCSVVSAASCTTNCAAPLFHLLQKNFGIECCSLITVHATTASQGLLDGPSDKDVRSGRGAMQNIIPSATGASKAVEAVIPALKGKIAGLAFRVPVPNVSIVEASVLLSGNVSLAEIMTCFETAEKGAFSGIISLSREALVSSDIVGNSHSCVVDVSSCAMIGARMFRLVAWYDNEMGYSSRVVDLARYMCG